MDQEFKKSYSAYDNMKKSEITSEEALKNREKELLKKQQEMQAAAQAFEMRRQSGVQEVYADLTKRAMVAMDELRMSLGWDAVEAISMGSVSEDFDLTDALVVKLDAAYAPEKKKREQKKEKESKEVKKENNKSAK